MRQRIGYILYNIKVILSVLIYLEYFKNIIYSKGYKILARAIIDTS